MSYHSEAVARGDYADPPHHRPGTLIDCINRAWTTLHRLDPNTKRTVCGLVWKPKKKGQVWVPDAAYFGCGRKCKRCFPRKRSPRRGARRTSHDR